MLCIHTWCVLRQTFETEGSMHWWWMRFLYRLSFCLFNPSTSLTSLITVNIACSSTAELDKYLNLYHIHFPHNKPTNICRTYEGFLCNRGPGYRGKVRHPLCIVSYCIFNIALYCQLDSQWRNYTMLVFRLNSVFDSPKLWIIENIEIL